MSAYEFISLYASHFAKYLPALILVAIAMAGLSFIFKSIKRGLS